MSDVFGLNLRHLEAISVIGRRGRMRAGAQRVNLSHPALAQAVSKVERVLAERLFERQPTGMSPTAAGHILIIRIDRALRFLTHGVRVMRREPARSASPSPLCIAPFAICSTFSALSCWYVPVERCGPPMLRVASSV